MHIEHVNLTVTDLDRSIAFYCDLLDACDGRGDRQQLAQRVDDHSYLALFTASADGPSTSTTPDRA
jgi:catechol 2,3-dioxygenase-like lactoylglutathione lyase family enzyme